uniref:NFKB inhibitor interacting Ras-like 2 n=1 Tax=Cyprinus carpio TaxID=7962 RepID=A0A8C2K6N8_CYPCA
MGKSCKVVVCGQGSVGKTAVLEQLLYANHVAGSETMETLEDIYIGSVETDRGTREQVRFYDTRGLRDGHEFPRHYFTFADGFVLVYSIDSKESFKRVEALKKDIDRCRDKKEVWHDLSDVVQCKLHDQTLFAMWFLKVSWSSKITPRFLTKLDGVIVDKPSWMVKSCCGVRVAGKTRSSEHTCL